MSDCGDNMRAGASSWPHSDHPRRFSALSTSPMSISTLSRLRINFAHQDARRSSAAGSNRRSQTNVRANAGRTRARRAGHRRAARGWGRFGARAIVRSADRSTLAVHAERAGILVDLPSRWHRAVWPRAAGRARHRRMPRSGGGCRGSSFTIVRWPDASDFLRLRTRNRPRTWPGGCS
jgi:hypothetical protein